METLNYEQQAQDFLNSTGTKMKIEYLNHACHFEDDKKTNTCRDIYKVTFKNSRGSFSLKFGQSIANSGQEPAAYDVLACLTKYDPYSFEDFCSEFGYDEDSRSAEKVYRAVCKEWESVSRIFSSEEIEQLQEIQ